MQTDNQCAASLIRCLAEVLRRGKVYEKQGDWPTYMWDDLSAQLDKAHVYGHPSGGARHFTLAALEQAADRLEEQS